MKTNKLLASLSGAGPLSRLQHCFGPNVHRGDVKKIDQASGQ